MLARKSRPPGRSATTPRGEALDLQGLTQAKRPQRLPSVFERGEIDGLLKHLEHPHQRVTALLYGGGRRLLEALRLRIQDIAFERSQSIVRSAKGAKDRVTRLPSSLVNPVREQMERAQALDAEDLAAGLGEAYLPDALARRCPNAARPWGWQYLFPAHSSALGPRSGKVRRHHVCARRPKRRVPSGGHAINWEMALRWNLWASGVNRCELRV
jgi:integrase